MMIGIPRNEEGVYEIRTLYYYENQNYVVDEDGMIVYDIFRYITPSLYYLFLKKKTTVHIKGIEPGVVYELVYPEDDEYEEEEYITLSEERYNNLIYSWRENYYE